MLPRKRWYPYSRLYYFPEACYLDIYQEPQISLSYSPKIKQVRKCTQRYSTGSYHFACLENHEPFRELYCECVFYFSLHLLFQMFFSSINTRCVTFEMLAGTHVGLRVVSPLF
jgi:hypothetical protein